MDDALRELFFAYAVLRLRAPAWPPDGLAPLPRLLPAVNTLVLLASSLALRLGTRPEAEENPGALFRALKAAIALGGLFLVLQLAVWTTLWRAGFTFASGIYGSIFYGLTTLHAVHILAGLVALALPRAGRAKRPLRFRPAERRAPHRDVLGLHGCGLGSDVRVYLSCLRRRWEKELL